MLQAGAEMFAELLAPILGRIRRNERTMWIALIALLGMLRLVGALRLELAEG
jgi:hypothetical protein